MSISLNALTPAVLTRTVHECGTDADLENENFLLHNLFKVNPEVNFTEDVKWGVDDRGIFLPGYSRPDDEAVAVEKSGQKLKTLTIPRIRRKVAIDKKFVEQLSVLVDNYTGPLNMDPMSQLQKKIYREVLRLRTMINRQTEVSAALALPSGQFAVNDEGGNLIDTVEFGYTTEALSGTRDPSKTIQRPLTGTDAWSSEKSKPLDDIRKLRRYIKNYAHWAGPVMIIAGWEACDMLINNETVAKLLHNRRKEMGRMSITAEAMFAGEIGSIPIFEYQITYDTASDKVTNVWDSKTIVMLPMTSNLFTVEFGPVFDYPNDDRQALPELIHTPYFSKIVRNDERPSSSIIVESNPMPVIWNPKGIRVLKVA